MVCQDSSDTTHADIKRVIYEDMKNQHWLIWYRIGDRPQAKQLHMPFPGANLPRQEEFVEKYPVIVI